MRQLVCLLLVACAGPDNVPVDDVPYADAARGWSSVLTPDGADFTCEWVEETCPTNCDGNVAPEFGEPVMIVNGVPSEEVQVGDHVVIRVPYSDADCNMGCGGASHGFSSPEASGDDSATLCSNQPCEGEAGFVFGVVSAGDYTWNMRMEDACGGDTERVEGSFSL